MGLDTSHNCWHGAYSSFHRFRKALARTARIPNLELMDGFYYYNEDLYHFKQWGTSEDGGKQKVAELFADFPIKWEMLNPDPIHELLYHSDCDGEINYKQAGKIAKRLRQLIPKLKKVDEKDKTSWVGAAMQFAKGLEQAAKAKENVVFS